MRKITLLFSILLGSGFGSSAFASPELTEALSLAERTYIESLSNICIRADVVVQAEANAFGSKTRKPLDANVRIDDREPVRKWSYEMWIDYPKFSISGPAFVIDETAIKSDPNFGGYGFFGVYQKDEDRVMIFDEAGSSAVPAVSEINSQNDYLYGAHMYSALLKDFVGVQVRKNDDYIELSKAFSGKDLVMKIDLDFPHRILGYTWSYQSSGSMLDVDFEYSSLNDRSNYDFLPTRVVLRKYISDGSEKYTKVIEYGVGSCSGIRDLPNSFGYVEVVDYRGDGRPVQYFVYEELPQGDVLKALLEDASFRTEYSKISKMDSQGGLE